MKLLFIFLTSIFSFLLVSGCSNKEKQAEKDLDVAKVYFAPLDDYRSVSCEIQLSLPQSFKTLKKAELESPSELKLWNEVFDAVETKAFSWSSSMGRCWVRGMSNVKGQFKNTKLKADSVPLKFMDSLDAQMKIGNCVLLQALFYNSPLSGLRYDRYDVKANPLGDGFILEATRGSGEISWSPVSKTLTSLSSSGEVFMASYESAAHDLRMKKATLKGPEHSIIAEDIKYEVMANGRLVISEYLLSLEQGAEPAVPQAHLKFKNCVSRVRAEPPPSPGAPTEEQ